MKKIAVFTSGGDAPGMNAAIRAVVRTGIHYNLEVIGILRGYDGMIQGDYIPLPSTSVANIIQKGGTILKTARSKDFQTPEGRKIAFNKLKDNGIEGIVCIGGNGTFTGADIFHQEFGIPSIGIPGTIDNDLYGTDYTLGFDTAVNTALEAIDKIRDTADSHNRTFFVEVMGRHAGFIALNTGISGGAEVILVPETKDPEWIDEYFGNPNKRKKSFSIVVVAEGNEEGGAMEITRRVKEKYPDVDPRVTILGHIQRGGSPTANDRILGTRLGVAAVEALLAGKSSQMVGLINDNISYTPFSDAIHKFKNLNNELTRIIDILNV